MHQYISRATNNLPRQQPAGTATCGDSTATPTRSHGQPPTMRVWPKKTGLMLGGIMRAVKELAPPGKQGLLYVCGPMLGGIMRVWRNLPPRKTGLIVRLWADAWRILPPGKQGSYCACCQGTRLWHHFPSSRAASFRVDLYFTLTRRMVLYSYSENGNAQ